MLKSISAGLPALQGGETGQVRKEAATTIFAAGRPAPTISLIMCDMSVTGGFEQPRGFVSTLVRQRLITYDA